MSTPDSDQTPRPPRSATTPLSEDAFADINAAYDSDGPRRKEGLLKRLGAGSFGISIIVHGLIVALAVGIVVQQALIVKDEPPPPFLPGGGGGEKSTSKRQKMMAQNRPKVQLAVSAGNSNISLPDTTTNLSDMTGGSLIGGNTMGGGGGLGSGLGKGGGVGTGLGAGIGSGKGLGFVALPPIMRSRCSPAERMQKMKENGGNEACETAVKKSLEWLKKNQNPDGSWGKQFKCSMTGLALLSYLGHCETPDSPLYGETVSKGMAYLITVGQKNQAPFANIISEKPSSITSTYEHGIACYALGEMYSFSKLGNRPLPGLREAFEAGTAVILAKQQKKRGAWVYKDGLGYDDTREDYDDLSLTGWQFQAMKAAKHTNLKISGLDDGMRRCEKYLENKQTKDGGFGNTDRTKHYNQWFLTGAAVLGLQSMGTGNAAKVTQGVRFILDQLKTDPLDWNKNCYVYTWYYNTQACFQKGGDSWKTWNEQLQPQLLANQNPDGSYKKETFDNADRVASSGAAGEDREIYKTCLCTLMLEVYYRYLKVGDREDGGTIGK